MDTFWDLGETLFNYETRGRQRGHPKMRWKYNSSNKTRVLGLDDEMASDWVLRKLKIMAYGTVIGWGEKSWHHYRVKRVSNLTPVVVGAREAERVFAEVFLCAHPSTCGYDADIQPADYPNQMTGHFFSPTPNNNNQAIYGSGIRRKNKKQKQINVRIDRQ